MNTTTFARLARIKPLDAILATARQNSLHRSLGAWQLTLLGIGGVIGTGIFVLTAEATQKAGPGMLVSFIISGARRVCRPRLARHEERETSNRSRLSVRLAAMVQESSAPRPLYFFAWASMRYRRQPKKPRTRNETCRLGSWDRLRSARSFISSSRPERSARRSARNRS